MTAAGPPAATEVSTLQESPPPAMIKSVTSGTTEIRYTLTRRTPAGLFEPVPVDTQLTASDEVRLTVQANEIGMIVLSNKEGPSSSAVTQPGRIITLAVPSGAQSMMLSFVPSPRRLVANTLVQSAQSYQASEARAKTAAPGALAGAPRSEAAEVQSDARLARATEEPHPQISVEIKLNRQ
jgi:hypothetical protein